jgi:hypothetical protein
MKFLCYIGAHKWRVTSMGRNRKTIESLGFRTVCDYTRMCLRCDASETMISADIPRKVRT